MQRFIYRGNFCTECGNPLAKPSGWWPRVFCAECAAQLRRSRRLPGKGWPWLVGVCAAGLLYALNHSAAQPGAQPANPPTAIAQVATAATTAPVTAPEETTAFCGARTRKGTPCRRLVKAGQRCAQHRGMASLLETKTNKATP